MRVERVGLRQWTGMASPSAGYAAAAETTITMPLDWASVMEMENGGDVRGSPTRKLVPREG